MPNTKCPEYSRLENEVEFTLKRLTEVTKSQLKAFHEKDQSLVMRLDKELETSVGRKERALGALRQHVKEHKCWPPSSAQIPKAA